MPIRRLMAAHILYGLLVWTGVSFAVGPLVGWWLKGSEPSPALVEADERRRRALFN